jgi:hypothetical protein
MLDVQCSMFDVHFLVNPSYESSCFFYDQTGRSRPQAATVARPKHSSRTCPRKIEIYEALFITLSGTGTEKGTIARKSLRNEDDEDEDDFSKAEYYNRNALSVICFLKSVF